MLEMVEARRNSNDAEERHDLLSSLLNASQEEVDDGAALSVEELIGRYSNVAPFFSWKASLLATPGNMFIFNLAGHEVGPPPSTRWLPKLRSVDHSAYTMLLIWVVGTLSG